MAPLNRKITVVFGISKYRSYGAFRSKSTHVSADIGAYTTIFVTPSPTVSAVNGHISAMDAAQILVETRAENGVATRNAARTVVREDMESWVAYVQGLIRAEPDPEQQMIIATSSGLDIKVNGAYVKPLLKATQMPTPGAVKLVAQAAGNRAAYEWQMSTNNGTTWVDLPTNNTASTTVTGLAVGTRLLFRFHSVVKNEISTWSYSVSVIMQ